MNGVVAFKPRLSEKAFAHSKELNTYVFMVPVGANKLTVAEAVGKHFKVTVENVNILNVKGKVKRTIRKDGRVYKGRQADSRKAYVTLKKGEHLPIFAAEEEEEKKAEKQAEKSAKKATRSKTETVTQTKQAESTPTKRRFFRRKAT